jgi:hypothetical protein
VVSKTQYSPLCKVLLAVSPFLYFSTMHILHRISTLPYLSKGISNSKPDIRIEVLKQKYFLGWDFSMIQGELTILLVIELSFSIQKYFYFEENFILGYSFILHLDIIWILFCYPNVTFLYSFVYTWIFFCLHLDTLLIIFVYSFHSGCLDSEKISFHYWRAPRGPMGVKKSHFFFTNETVFLLR